MPTQTAPTGRASTAIVFLTHCLNPSIDEEMRQIAAAAGPAREFWSTAYVAPGATIAPLVPSPWTFVPIAKADIAALDYGAKFERVKNWKSLRFNLDLLLLTFFKQHPGYDHYWFIEFDVRYSGDWRSFLDELDASPADLLCTHVNRRSDTDRWMHWLDFVTPIPASEHVRGFLPICRVSRRLLAAVDQAYREDWCGHAEAVWPTLALSRGWPVEDIGGNGAFVPDSRRDRFYFSARMPQGLVLSTFSFWPFLSLNNNFHAHRLQSQQNILWHPVK